MTILDKGCFCCELETCVKVHSFLLTGGFCIFATVNVVFLVYVTRREVENTNEENGWYIRNAKLVIVVLLLFLLLWVLVGAMLLCGVYKRKRALFWPYILAGSLNSLIFLGLLLYFATIVNTQIYVVAIIALILVLQCYCLIHVISLYQRFGMRRTSSSSSLNSSDNEKLPVRLTACRRTLGCLPSPAPSCARL